MSEWISVDDRLPEDGDEILMWSEVFHGVVLGDRSDGEWWNESDIITTAKITHWQPLPEPPK